MNQLTTFFSWQRFMAIVKKEFTQMLRDRVTFAIMIGIPLLQLILFGFAINADPRHLPTAVLSADNSQFSRSIISALQVSTYFDVTAVLDSREQAERMLREGRTIFVVTIPEQFSRKLIRGERPVLLIEADATDPASVGMATGALQTIVQQALSENLKGALAFLQPEVSPVDIRIHAQYNPEAITQYNIVPGLMGVILSMTLVIITGLSITRENERGTMENLLCMPVRPLEVMLGKITPYMIVGYAQIFLVLLAAIFLFEVPMHGSIVLLLVVSFLFIVANLSVGITFSTLARNQLQSMQLSFFFFLPSILLSGFMFPFKGMPQWAQIVGSVLPLTHYLRITRGILLKGNGISDVMPHVWPIVVFWIIVLGIGLLLYRRTMD
jgi:ABC-2 type transport system permease protein